MKQRCMLLIISTLTTALIAGLFYAWSCSVIPGIRRLPDHGYLSAMQAMNRAIINPVFLLCFLGTAVLLPITVFVYYQQPLTGRCWFLIAATLFYLAGVTGITFLGNIPLNNMLDAFNISTATTEELARQRAAFELPWNRLHTIRAVAAVIALLLMLLACVWENNSASFPENH